MKSSQFLSVMKEKGYSFAGEQPFAVSVQDYLARHDVVFGSPMKGGFEGLPLGNGDLSAMVWTTERAIVMQINKNDLWTQPNQETSMLERSCGQLRIEFDEPCFEWLYLEQFEMRLNLGRERILLHSKTPFSDVHAEIWIDPDQNLLLTEVSAQDGEGRARPFRVVMERYGSRAFRSWYSIFSSDAKAGLGNASVEKEASVLSLLEPFSEQDHIALSMRLAASGCESAVTARNRCGILECTPSGEAVLLQTAVSVQPDAETAKKETAALLNVPLSAKERKSRRDAWWKEYWDRSFLCLSSDGTSRELDYLENLYYVQVYALGCASRGQYPMTFNGGAFTWNHDIRQWVNPHHWNTQQAYWSVEAMNRPEQMLPYLRAYSRMIPAAKKFAQESHGVKKGMLISEAHDFSGRMLLYFGALTPASQIGQQFWNHYLYSGDLDYLRDTGYPFIKECADFYADYATFDSKTGKYAIGPAGPGECEFGENFWNTSLDLAAVRYILPAAIRSSELLGVDADKRAEWKHLLENLSDFAYHMDCGKETISPCLDENGNPVDFGRQNTTFCRNTAPLMPCPVIGSRDKGTRLYDAVCHAAENHTRSALAITPISAVWARLGDGDRALTFLLDSVDQLQHFPQGFFYNIDHWFQYSRYAKDVPDFLTRCQRDYIYDEQCIYPQIPCAETGEHRDLPARPFAQCGFETAGILTLTLQEMFLQSYEEIIRLGTALPEGVDGAFTLRAAGAFLVTGFVKAGKVLPLAVIRSDAGAPCRVEPWFAAESLQICLSDGSDVPYEITSEGDILFTISKGSTALLWSSKLSEEEIPDAVLPVYSNGEAKTYKNARIGSFVNY